MSADNPLLPVKRAPTSPTVWSRAAPVVAQGAALVAVGVLAEMALTALAKGALRLPSRKPRKEKAVAVRRNGREPAGSYAVSETIVMRRVIYRR